VFCKIRQIIYRVVIGTNLETPYKSMAKTAAYIYTLQAAACHSVRESEDRPARDGLRPFYQGNGVTPQNQ